VTDVACFVVRHADAGARGAVDDDKRELSRRGRAQADGLADALADAGIGKLLSSPYTRCVQTLIPLADRLGQAVNERDDLGEGAGAAAALAIVERAVAPVVLCSHGDVIGELMELLARRGVPLDDDRVAKGSTWVLTVRDGEVVDAHYVPPPPRDPS
jgi:8-oxo-dGTP diphosphatase